MQRLFDAFQTLGSAYAVVRDLRQHDVKLPMRDGNGQLVWRTRHADDREHGTASSALRRCLCVGASSDADPHRPSGSDDPHAVGSARWRNGSFCLHDRVPAYITWEQYLANQRQLLQNLRRPAPKARLAAARRCWAVSLLWALRPQDACHLSIDPPRPLQLLAAACFDPTEEVCGGLPARGLDELVAQQVLQALTPAAIELSLSAIEHTSEQRRQQEAQLRQNLERAVYEAERAERQYQAVEPENRLVARTLEQRWEAALRQQCATQEAYDRFQTREAHRADGHRTPLVAKN